QIEKLPMLPGAGTAGRYGRDLFDRCEAGGMIFGASVSGERRLVAFVEPPAALGREDSRETFAIEIQPLVHGTIHASGQVFHASRISSVDFLPNDGVAVCKLQRWQGFFEITTRVGAFVPALADRGDERGNGMAMATVVWVVTGIPIDEVRRTHQAIR